MGMGWRECLMSLSKDGTALSNSVTPTSILHPASKYPYLANQLQEGHSFLLEVVGRMSNMNPTPGNLTLEAKLGSTVVMTTGAIPLNTAGAKTNVAWRLGWDFDVRAVGGGTNANLFHVPKFECQSVNGAGTGVIAAVFMPDTPGVGAGFNSGDTAAGALLLDLIATFSVANAANSIQVHKLALHRTNSY